MERCAKSTFDANWKFFAIVLIPIFLIFIPFVPIVTPEKGSVTSKESLCLYVLLVMVCYWTLNVMPLVVTALIPLADVPLFGIRDGKELAKNYMKEPTMLVFGALMIACAFIGSDLHKRIALKIMSLAGNSTQRLITLIFLLTTFLAMFTTSIAASLIMVATTQSLIDERETVESDEKQREVSSNENSKSNFREREDSTVLELPASIDLETSAPPPMSLDSVGSVASNISNPREQITESGQNVEAENQNEAQVEIPKPAVDEKKMEKSNGERELLYKKLKRQFFITVYIAANIGGLFLPHDTPVSNILYDWGDDRKNKILMGRKYTNESLALILWKGDKKIQLTCAKWVSYVVPILVVVGLIAWLYLSIIFTHLSPVIPDTTPLFSRVKPEGQRTLSMEKAFYQERYRELGRTTFQQIVVIVLTFIVFLLWIFRDPRTFDGWARHIPNQGGTDKKVKAGYSAPAILIVTIMFMIPRLGSDSKSKKDKEKAQAILGWKFLEAQVYWNILLLMGGCFAIAECVHVSGLSVLLYEHFVHVIETMSLNVVHLYGISLSLILSELCGGVASVSIIAQIFVVISQHYTKLGYVSMPVTVMSMLSFMLPVATPSNALVFSAATGELKVLDMLKYGAVLNLISWIVVVSLHLMYGNLHFDK